MVLAAALRNFSSLIHSISVSTQVTLPMATGIFKKKSNLSLQRQLLLLLLLSTALPVAIVGGYGATSFTRVTSRALLEDFEEEAASQSDIIQTFLNDVKKDVLFLADSFLLQGFIQ